MIDGIDESLRALLLVFLGEDKAEVRFEAPTADLGSKGAVVDVFLYDVADELEGLHADYWDVRDESGQVVARQGGIHRIRFAYLVTAFAKDVATEHRLLGKVLRGVVESPLIPRSLLVGELADEPQPTQLRIARPLDNGRPKPHELWPALGMAARSSIELEVVAPLRPTPLAEIAPPARSIDVGFDRGYRGVPNGTMMQPAVPPGLTAADDGDDKATKGKGKGKGDAEGSGLPDGFNKTTPPAPHERKWTAFRIREKTEDDKPAR